MKSTINEDGVRQLYNIDFNDNVIVSDVRLSKTRPPSSSSTNSDNSNSERTCYVVGKTKTKTKKVSEPPLTLGLKLNKARSKSSESPGSPGFSSIEVFENYARSTTPNSTTRTDTKKPKGLIKASSFKDLISPLMKKRFNYHSKNKSLDNIQNNNNNNKNNNNNNSTSKQFFKRSPVTESERETINTGNHRQRQLSNSRQTDNSSSSVASFLEFNESDISESDEENDGLSFSFTSAVNNISITEEEKVEPRDSHKRERVVSSSLTQSDCSFSDDSDSMEKQSISTVKTRCRKSRQKDLKAASRKQYSVNFADPNNIRTTSPGSSNDSQYGGSTSSLSTVSSHSFSTTTISSLPDALLLRVFQYLTTRDICQLSKVCRRWFSLYLAPSLWEKIEITNCTSLNMDLTTCGLLQRLAYTASCLSVRQFKLDSCAQVTDGTLKTIALRCPELRSLEISSCEEITPKGIIHVLINCPNLLYLNASRCDNISNFSQHTSEASLSVIFSELRYLDLSSCSCLTDDDLHYLLNRMPSLEYLYLRQCDCVSNVGIETIGMLCPNLKEISINDCVNVTDNGVVKLLSRCRMLRYISLSKCPITNTSLEQISAVQNNFLRHLNLNECEYITDSAIMKISASCPRLRSIDIGKCVRLTDASLYGLSRCLFLRRVNLKSCVKITDAGIRKLATTCAENLRNLDVRGCSFSPETFEYVRFRCPQCQLQHSNITQF